MDLMKRNPHVWLAENVHVRMRTLLIFLAMAGLPPAAFGQSEQSEIDRVLALLSAPPATPLSGAIPLLNACRKVGIGTFKLCTIPQVIAVARGEPPGGLDPLFTASANTAIFVQAELSTPAINVDVLVNGTRCPLSNGMASCPVPVGSGSDLNVDFFPSQSGETNLLAGAILRIESVTLRRGFDSVLLSLRAHADSLEASLNSDLAVYSRFDKQVRYQGVARADLMRIFASLTTEHIPPLPEYNTAAVGADGKETRNSACPLKPSADPETWSHTAEECVNLSIVTGLINGEPVFSDDDVTATRARIEQSGSALGKIANALAANGKALEQRFQDLLTRLRNKGVNIP